MHKLQSILSFGRIRKQEKNLVVLIVLAAAFFFVLHFGLWLATGPTGLTVYNESNNETIHITDYNNKYYGEKLTDEPLFETFFTSIEQSDNQLTIKFHHDSTTLQPIWIEGNVSYFLSKNISNKDENITLIVELIKGIVPKFKLHVGHTSEVFEFGKEIPKVNISKGNYTLLDRNDSLIDVKINKNDSSVVIKGIKSSKINAKIGESNESILKTNIFAADNLSMEEAEITLPISGEVNVILECPDFNITTFTCLSTWQKTNISFTKNISNIIFTVNHFSGYAGGYINVLNVQSYPTINGTWTVSFTTNGTHNLTIEGINGTNFSTDLNFLKLACGNTTINTSYDGTKVFVANFSCNTTAYETSKVLTYGKHHLKFTFGNATAYAHNLVVTGQQNISILNLSYYGNSVGDGFGNVMAIGDFNGDGQEDYLMSALNANYTPYVPFGKNVGAVYIVYGRVPYNGTFNISTKANSSWIGEPSAALPVTSNAGESLAVGDVNNDSIDDFLIGSPGVKHAAGAFGDGSAYLVYGQAAVYSPLNLLPAGVNAVFKGNSSASAGIEVALGDLNNDGFDDVIVGEPYYPAAGGGARTGLVHVFFGPIANNSNFWVNQSNITINGTYAGGLFGHTLAVGDFNGGGDDLIVSAYNNNSRQGAVYVFYGPLSAGNLSTANANLTFYGEHKGDLAGWSLSTGDVLNNGFDEILVGAYNATNTTRGKAYLLYGGPGFSGVFNISAFASTIWVGDSPGDQLGYSVALGDQDNNSRADAMIGAPGFSGIAPLSGALFFAYSFMPVGTFNVSNGTNGSLIGLIPSQSVGVSVASGSLAVGAAQYHDPIAATSGIVYIEPPIPPIPPSPPVPRPPGGGGGGRGYYIQEDCEDKIHIDDVYYEEPLIVVEGTTDYPDAFDVTVAGVGTVRNVKDRGDGSWKVSVPFNSDVYDYPVLLVQVINLPSQICTQKEYPICYGEEPEEESFGLSSGFYNNNNVAWFKNEKDGNTYAIFNVLPGDADKLDDITAELTYCKSPIGPPETISRQINWARADGNAIGSLWPDNICELCAPYYASAATGAGAAEITAGVAAEITAGVAAEITGGSVAGGLTSSRASFPDAGVMPQVFGGGSGTYLGVAVFDVKVKGEAKGTAYLPSVSSVVDSPITGMAVAGQLQPVFQLNPHAIIDNADLDDVPENCNPKNHPDPVPPPGSPVPGPIDVGGVDIPSWPGSEPVPGPEEPLPSAPADWPEEPEPAGPVIPLGDIPLEDLPSVDFNRCALGYLQLGLCVPPKNMVNPVAYYPQFSVVQGDDWRKGNFADACADIETVEYCSARYSDADYQEKYWTPRSLLEPQTNTNAITGSVVNEITGSSVAGSCAGAGNNYNCGAGIGTPQGSDSVTHLSMINNALGVVNPEHGCEEGVIMCFPCPAEFIPRKTPMPEQPENPSVGVDDPGCGWIHYCGVDGDLHTLFYGPFGVTSPTGFVVPPMEPFKTGFFGGLSNLISGSAVAGSSLPQSNLVNTIQSLANNIYENQQSAGEYCVEKQGVCGPDGRCLNKCPPAPKPTPEPPYPGPPPLPPRPGPPIEYPGPPGFVPPPGLEDTVDTTMVREMPLYCTAATVQASDSPLIASYSSEDVFVPSGYELIGGPVKFNCNGDSLDIKFNVPDNFKDIRAYRCSNGACKAVTDVETFNDELVCDGMPVSEYRRQELLSGDTYLDVKEMEVIRKVELQISPEKKSLTSQGYVFEFQGSVPFDLRAGLYSPDFDVPFAANPSISISGTPMVIEFDKPVPSGASARIRMPYKYTAGFDETSMNIYLLQNNKWIALDSVVNKENKFVDAVIYDLPDYVKDNKLVFAVMAIKCEACIVSRFNKVYDPDSRDAIILIHGLTSSSDTWQFLIDDYVFNKQPWQIWTFDYPSYMTVDEMAKDLADSIQLHNDEFDNIYIVGHSLGGFISQRALEIANEERSVYPFLRKVKKVILAGNPGRGSPAAGVYKNLVDNLINIKSMAKMFDLNSAVLADLTKGRVFDRVPGVDYYVVAGSQTYEFNLGFFTVTSAELFELLDVNDGIITTQSASFVGGEYIKDACADYFEVKLTHTELIDASIPRRVIARIISEDKVLENPDYAYLGYNQYVDIKPNNCNADEYYIVVGKRISELETPGVLFCSCGNGVCGEGETPDNCPQDCMNLYTLGSVCMFLPLMILLLLFILVALTVIYFTRKYVKKIDSGNTWQGVLWFFVFVTLLALLMLWFMCNVLPLISWIVLILISIALFVDLAMPRLKELSKEP